MITVTKTFLPPIEEYQYYLQKAWDTNWITNRGKLVTELEKKLKKYLGLSNILVVNNGTIPLQIALKLLGKQGEIITTPFSYIATTAAIVWENCSPVFVDIHPDYLTIDETKIEAAITNKTTAILATHVFGNPCNVISINNIAKRYNLKVIYDAAHAFGVTYKENSLFNYGDISTCSFHATKLFHTGEGGAIFSKNKKLRKQIFYSHNFGHTEVTDFYELGINAKISETQAAMGLSVLPYLKVILGERSKVISFYDEYLDFSKLKKIRIREYTNWNYSYYPVIFESTKVLLLTLEKLEENNIFPRRYFYPSLNKINYTNSESNKMPVSEYVSSRIVCLPLYVGLKQIEIKLICKIINENI